MIVDNGTKVFDVESEGRGSTTNQTERLRDVDYTASDKRSVYMAGEKIRFMRLLI